MNMDYQAILDSLGNKVYRSGNEEYIERGSCVGFVQLLSDNNFAVIGIELFEVSDGKIRPLMDWIADWSQYILNEKGAEVEKCREWSLKFLSSCPSGPHIYGNFTVLSHEELLKGRDQNRS
jgi:hypothetical protein